ncbi:hypothetical protein BAUCODRAFT_37721 [Baudoinia panamericana UAMH 10762]|uniref:Mitochondrial zinc maintenance protein 1, mitochondrial n=1 Tax=Baudoinia panamericana (strain UAMH 10762) TaxID=717646 RepID=M2N1H9_BAUPA|nr:uncharacterized protein BAUCODRAFT_37721 [Baudoinia panamericana UAMH 10762]EMC92804.1 hypothetical protein BAUCODRAFT_37721 [Baudoinia panamericana UAMH 10762]
MSAIPSLKHLASKTLTPIETARNREAALATYRHLLRATGIAFRDDERTLKASRQLARESFDNSRKWESGGGQAAQAIEHAQGVAKILLENVVQGRQTGPDQYKLGIHDKTQRADNQTATQLKGTKKSFKEIKNAQF